MSMRVDKLSVTIVVAALAASCERESKSGSSPGAPVIIYRSEDGRIVTDDELKEATGTFRYEIIGANDVSPTAKRLHAEGRAAGGRGDYDEATKFLQRAAAAAPNWPYPVYDLAFTYLLQKDFENARLYYRKTIELSPRGYYTAITAIDTLERERKGEFPAGLYLNYLSLEWMNDPSARADVVRQLTDRHPGFAPGWKERSLLADSVDERLRCIERGLSADPDAETKGILSINKALAIREQGDIDGAVNRLGAIVLDPHATFATTELAKASLANVQR